MRKEKKSLLLLSGDTEAGKTITNDGMQTLGGSEESGACLGKCSFVTFVLLLSRDDKAKGSLSLGFIDIRLRAIE